MEFDNLGKNNLEKSEILKKKKLGKNLELHTKITKKPFNSFHMFSSKVPF